MLSCWVSSSEVEQDFSYVQLLQTKSKIGDQHLHYLLKVLLDGPSPQDLAPQQTVRGMSTYTATQAVLRCQAQYRKDYGTAVNQRKKPHLPRRVRVNAPQRAARGVQGFLRERQHEMATLARDSELLSDQQLAEQSRLESATKSAVSARETADLKSLSETLEEKQAIAFRWCNEF